MSDLVARLRAVTETVYDGSMSRQRPYPLTNEAADMIEAQAAQIAALKAQLAKARNDALEEAVQAVHEECWTDGDDNEITRAEQNTVTLAIRAIRAMKGE